MRKCDTCGQIIPVGETNRIHVEFTGKFTGLLKKLYGDSYLDFCSLSCFNSFKIPEKDAKERGAEK